MSEENSKPSFLSVRNLVKKYAYSAVFIFSLIALTKNDILTKPQASLIVVLVYILFFVNFIKKYISIR